MDYKICRNIINLITIIIISKIEKPSTILDHVLALIGNDRFVYYRREEFIARSIQF